MNDDYIGYAAKEGKVRILRRSDGANTLFREHTASIVDMAICRKTGMIVSLSENHSLFVWEIVESAINKSLIETRVILKIQEPARSTLTGPYLKRVFWHPTDERIIAVLTAQNEIAFLQLSETNTWKESSSDLASLTLHTIPISLTSITAFTFSPDGSLFATGSNDGFVRLWSYTTRSMLQDFKPYKGLPISSLFFIVTSSGGLSPLPLLLIGADNNRTLGIWNTVTGVCVQTLSFISVQETFGLLPNLIEYAEAASCLVYSCTSRKSLYVLRFQGPDSANVKKSTASKGFELQESLDAKFDFSHSGFVFMAGFRLTMPILSMIVKEGNLRQEKPDTLSIVCIQTKAVQEYEQPLSSIITPSGDQRIVEGIESPLPEAVGWKKVLPDTTKPPTEKKRIKIHEDETGTSARDREAIKVRFKMDSRKGPIEILKKPRGDLPSVPQPVPIEIVSKEFESPPQEIRAPSPYPRMINVQDLSERPQAADVTTLEKLDSLVKASEAQYQATSQLLELMGRFSSTMERVAKEAVSASPQRIQESIVGPMERALKTHASHTLLDEASLGKLADLLNTQLVRNMTDTFREQFLNSLVPAFERACQEMFRQMDRAISTRLQDCKSSIKPFISPSAMIFIMMFFLNFGSVVS